MKHNYGYVACAICEGIFRKKNRNHKYCSDPCANVAYEQRKARRQRTRPVLDPIECGMCKQEFVPHWHNTRYCCAECRALAAWQWLQRDRFAIFERDGFRCAYCGRASYLHAIELVIDDVVPWVKGGPTIAGNLITSCARCNSAKWSNPLRKPELILDEIRRRNDEAGIGETMHIKVAESRGPDLIP